ncbi:MAG TPA: hypothetical protein ENJ68_04805, partial [Devosia sp.]|nr:hypothetical protein [Devosia sp.]
MSILSKKKPPRTPVQPKAEPDPRARENARRIIDALLGPVLVDKPVFFPSDGAVERHQAIAAWMWMIRDIDAKLEREALNAISDEAPRSARSAFAHKLSRLIESVVAAAQKSHEFARRTAIQMGGAEEFERLPQLASAFRHQKLLSKAVTFGQAINAIQDENSLKLALQSFPVDDEM